MIKAHGRKFFVCMIGIASVVLLTGWAIAHEQPDPSASTGAIALMVGAYCGSNAWAKPKVVTPQTSEGDS
jgi:hypothetical protein